MALSPRKKSALIGIVVMVVVVIVLIFRYPHPECGHDPEKGRSQYLKGPIVLSDSIADVPEFHDCQKFLKPGTREFEDHPFAIFARTHLELVYETQKIPVMPKESATVSTQGRGGGTVRPTVPEARRAPITTTVPGGQSNAGSVAQTTTPQPGNSTGQPAPEGQEDFCAVLGGCEEATAKASGSELTTTTEAASSGVVLGAAAGIPPGDLPPISNQWIAIATIVSFGSSYAPLKIEPGVNCVYLRFTSNGPQARIMAQQKLNNGNCPELLPPSTPPDDHFAVVATGAPPGLSENDIPPVARWEWDGKQYYIITRCFRFQCEIGASDFRPTPAFAFVPEEFAGSYKSRVFRIKLWYDAQILSVGKPGTETLMADTTYGIVVPHPDLELRTKEDYQTGRFVDVAYMYVSSHGYKGKMNITKTVPSVTRNVLQIQAKKTLLGWLPLVPDYKWTGQVISAENPKVIKKVRNFKFTKQPDIEQFPLWHTARWRWQKKDETVWFGCPAGCCTCGIPCT